MDSTTTLLLDSNYLCWRSFHSLKYLSHNELRTEIVYGYLKTMLDLQRTFFTTKVVHCFDGGHLKRKEIYPAYKGNRKPGTPEEERTHLEVVNQIQKLQKEYLPGMGFKNVLAVKGYEADDVIASLCHNNPELDRVVIVSADKDLWQLLSKRVTIYNVREKTMLDKAAFVAKWGIKPKEWPKAKAIAGCTSDNVDGIKGVAEVTAAKYLRGELTKGDKYQSIVDNQKLWESNLVLVRLPYAGCPVFSLVEDGIDKRGWLEVTRKLGIKSLNP